MPTYEQQEKAREMSSLGVSLLEQNRVAEGIFLFKEALAASPEDACIFWDLASAHYKRKDYWSAVKLFWITLEKFKADKDNLDKHPESLLIIQDKLRSALEIVEKEGLAYLQARGPDGVNGPGRATVIFERALEFAPEKLSLRKNFITALWLQGKKVRAFACLKRLILDLVTAANLKNLHQLNEALRVYLPGQPKMSLDGVKKQLTKFLRNEQTSEAAYNRFRKILEVLLPK